RPRRPAAGRRTPGRAHAAASRSNPCSCPRWLSEFGWGTLTRLCHMAFFECGDDSPFSLSRLRALNAARTRQAPRALRLRGRVRRPRADFVRCGRHVTEVDHLGVDGADATVELAAHGDPPNEWRGVRQGAGHFPADAALYASIVTLT